MAIFVYHINICFLFVQNDIAKSHPEDKQNHERLMKKLADRLSANGKVLCAAGTNMVTLSMSA
jgi:hypothetical protein